MFVLSLIGAKPLIVRMRHDGPVLLTVLRTSTFGSRAVGVEGLSCGRPARHGLARGRQHSPRVRTRIKALVTGERVLPEFGRRLLRRDVNGAIRPSRADDRRLAGAWKEGEMAQGPGPLRPFPARRQQCRRVGDRREAHGRGCVVRPLVSLLEVEFRRLARVVREWSDPGAATACSGTQIASTRCEGGNPLGRETALADAVSEAGGVDVSSRGRDWAWMSGRGPDGSVAGFLQGTAEIHRLMPATIKRSWSDHHRRIDDSHREVAK